MRVIKLLSIFLLFCAVNRGLIASDRIPGTSVQMKAPAGFSLSSYFPGYISKSSGATITVSELEGANVNELMEIYTPSGMAEFGMRFLSKKEVSLANSQGTLLEAEQRIQGASRHRWILMFDNPQGAVMVTAIIPSSRPSSEYQEISNSLLSCRISADNPISVSEGLAFTIEELGDLKLATRIQNNIVLTLHGLFPLKEKGSPFVIVGRSVSEYPIPTDELPDFSRNRLLQTAKLEDVYVIDEETMIIDGLQAHYIVGEGFHEGTGRRTSIDQCILSSGKEYYIFQAIVESEQRPTYAEAFMDTLYSFKRSEVKRVPDIVGFWKSETIDGHYLEYTFEPDGTVLWSVPPEGQVMCKYKTRAGARYPEMDVYDFEMPNSEGIRFHAIFSVAGDTLRIEGVPTKYGLAEDGTIAVRPDSFGTNSIRLKRHTKGAH